MKAILLSLILLPALSWAKIVNKNIEYKVGDKTYEGYLAWDDSKGGTLPGVVIIHDWMGLTDDPKNRANMLAELGYVALAADVYGKGVRPKNGEEAAKLATGLKGDVKSLRARALAAYDQLKAQSQVDKNKIAVMGYCFGGTTALEMGRAGPDVKGIVSFHGGLATPNPKDAKNIKGKVLVLHGADDPYVPAKEVDSFEKEMRDAKIDWQMVSYGNAVHAFTIKGAGTDNSKGAAYNEKADRRSWEDMQDFFKEIFQ